jgi:tetratricopeptide (TPR) repeat protein
VDSPEQALREAHAAEVEGNLAGAESILRDSCKRWKREPEFKMRHGRVLRRMGLEKKALKVYRTLLKAHPQRADAATAAAECAMALAVGASSDESTAGLCRAMWLRGQKEEAWQRALQAFVQQGRIGKSLHAFLEECAPILGEAVPELDLLEIGEFAEEPAGLSAIRTESQLPQTAFASDSMEAMAGIAADDLTTLTDVSVTDALLSSGNEEGAAVDMSALALPKPDISARPEVEIPEDLLDFD